MLGLMSNLMKKLFKLCQALWHVSLVAGAYLLIFNFLIVSLKYLMDSVEDSVDLVDFDLLPLQAPEIN